MSRGQHCKAQQCLELCLTIYAVIHYTAVDCFDAFKRYEKNAAVPVVLL